MILKHNNYKNGYCFVQSSNDYDLQKLILSYGDKFKRVICNQNTARNFKVTDGYAPITINNKLNDGCFFINCIR